jgi:DNA helicase HerA-like ATPase
MDQTVTALQEIFGPLKEIGVVIGEARPLSFVFMIRPELSDTIPVWEYVITPLNKGIVVAQIQNAVSFSSILSKELEFSAASKLISAGIEEFKHLREARVLAYIEDINGFMNNGSSDEVTYRPRYVVHPASPVFLAPKPLLELLYSGKGKTIYVGNLVTRGDVKVHFSIRGFMRHVAIIAQTGAGKSYLVGVIIEELLRQGATIIVIDPHADHIKLTIPTEGWPPSLAERVKVFSPQDNLTRYADVKNIRKLLIKFSDLTPHEIFYITGVHEKYTRIRRTINEAMRQIKNSGAEITIQSLIQLLENMAKQGGKAGEVAESALNYLQKLQGLSIFGDRTTILIEELLKPKQVCIIDLSGISDREADLITYLILKKLIDVKMEGRDHSYKFPVFLIVEEVHKFAPPSQAGETLSLPLFKRVAGEGRKFGLFLIAVSQRPSKINPDVLSQCNSQIIMRITNPVDQRTVLEASERLGEYLFEDLPGLDRGEAIVVGEITSLPVIMKVRKRHTIEGGADIDVDRLLDEALRCVDEEERERETLRKDWDNFIRWSRPI